MGAIVVNREIPGDTLTAVIFDRCSFCDTTGTLAAPAPPASASVFGTCAEGRASNTRCRWRE